jgi:hypothetical protein
MLNQVFPIEGHLKHSISLGDNVLELNILVHNNYQVFTLDLKDTLLPVENIVNQIIELLAPKVDKDEQ